VALRKGTLPFTGFPVWLVAMIGLMLIVAAVAVRGLSRGNSAQLTHVRRGVDSPPLRTEGRRLAAPPR